MNINKMPRTVALISLLLTYCAATQAQDSIPFKKLDLRKPPGGLVYEGTIVSSARWTDSLGDNMVILTESGIYQRAHAKHENGGRNADVFAYRFLVLGDSATQAWKLHDNIGKCSDRVDAHFLKNSLHVTDLDSDGKGEVWLAYIKGCRRDSVPCDMKLVMYEETVPSTLTGQNRVYLRTDEMGGKHYSGGDYAYDTPFYEGPKVFLEYARKQWHQNLERQD